MKGFKPVIYITPANFQMILLFFIMQFQLSAQTDNIIYRGRSRENMSGSHLLCIPYRDLNPFNDLPGEVNTWGWGTVYLHTGDSLPERHLLYNALGSNLLWIQRKGESSLLVDKTTVSGFTIRSEKDNQLLRYEYFPVAEWYYSDGKGAFLEVLVKDTVSLYGLSTIEKFPMSDNLKAHIYYFIGYHDNDLIRILPNRRSLCRTLGNKKEFKKHLKRINLRANRRNRIIKAVEEYNRFNP